MSNQTDTIRQIFALQPEGVVGGDINPLNMELIRGGGSDSSTFFRDLDYMDMLEAAEDEELFRMLGVNSSVPTPEFPTAQEVLESQQTDAAQEYIDALSDYIGRGDVENKKALDNAKTKLVELDVPRSTIESVTNDRFDKGIDTSSGISGVMGPSASGALEGAVERGSELFGLGAEGIASLIGADKALSSALLNVPKPGVTFVFGEGGQKTPVITGQTSAGTQVGVTDPYGIADIFGSIQEGSLGLEDIIAGGAGAVAAATALSNDDDKNKKTGVKTGVNVTLGDESGADPATKVADDATAGDAVDIIERTPTGRVPVDGLQLPDRTSVADLPKISTTDRTSVADIPKISTTDRTTVGDIPKLSTAELDKILADIGGRPAVPGGYDVPVLATSADKIPVLKTLGGEGGGGEGGGGGGGTGIPEQSASPTGGIRGVATEKAGVADIAMLYDPSLSLAENMARILGKDRNKQADAVDSVLMYGGGIVQPTDLNDELLRIIGSR